jgi:hypothetical protein
LYGAETLILRKVHQRYLGSFKTWCWRMENIIWTDRVRNEVLYVYTVKEKRHMLQTIKRKTANWKGHI